MLNRLGTQFFAPRSELISLFLRLISTGTALYAVRLAVDQNGRLSGGQVEGASELRFELLQDNWLNCFAIKPNIEHGIVSST